MIKCNVGNVTIEGQGTLVLAEYATLTRAMHKVFTEECGMSPEKSKDKILEAVNQGFMTEEQVKNKADEVFDSVISMLTALRDAMQGKDDE